MRRSMYVLMVGLIAACLATSGEARACTNYLLSRGSTTDGSTMITYTADSHTFYGQLTYSAGAMHLPGTFREIVDGESGERRGKIPQVARTYTVIGQMNEHQVSVTETTFGGLKASMNPDGMIDYGTLMNLALERARTAREAVSVMTSVAEKHGYGSSGESFSISDPKEVWILEMVGTGKGGKGAIWVARRVPDGFVSAHANQARVRRFPQNDRKDTLYSKNVISFARSKGWFKGQDGDFSFADTYGPATYASMRACEARVWAMFRRVSKSADKYLPWIKGKEGAEPMPLWIKPDRKLTVRDVMELQRDHFEGTEYDMRWDIGAGPYTLPYRWRPLYWYTDAACDDCEKKKEPKEVKSCLEKKKCVRYLNERSTSTQQTGFSIVAQARSWMPAAIGGLLWFGVDDTASTVYMPMYAGLLRAPHHVAEGTGDFKTFHWDSAWWVFNFVANFSYSRYRDMIEDIRKVQRELEGSFLARQPDIEKHALVLFKESPERARDYVTRYSEEQAKRTVERWRRLLTELLMKYLDGNVRDERGKVTHPGYPKEFYKRLVRERGEHFRVRKIKGEPPEELLE
jgi:dipeptidase